MSDKYKGYNDAEAHEQLAVLDREEWYPNAVRSERAWGVLYGHRKECLRVFRDRIVALLDDPAMNRAHLRRAIADICTDIEQRGV